MSKFVDITGQRFGRLVVVGRAENIVYPCGEYHTRVRCKCDCGNEVVVTKANLQSGNTNSCGCYRAEWARKRMREIGKRSYKLKEQRV